MKIGVIVDNELNGDIRVLREIGILREQGFEIFVLCLGYSGKKYNAPVDNINISRMVLPRKLKDILFFFLNLIPAYEWLWASGIKNQIKKHDLDYLHVHDLYMSRSARKGIEKSGKRIPMILDLHENYPFTVKTYNWTKGFLRNLLSRPGEWEKKELEYLEYADRIIVLSEEFKYLISVKYPGLNKEKFVIFPNVPDLNRPEYHYKNVVAKPFPNDFPVLFYYGIIAERRGIFDALKVFSDLVREDYPVNLLLIGPVDKKDRSIFTELIDSVIVKDRIHYIHWINSSDFPGYLEISDICLAPFYKNPQHESGIANKIYDYMLGGKPLIASDCRPQQNLIEKFNCGLIFKNLNEFHDAIIRLLNDEPLRRQMGENGKKAITGFYNTATFKDRLISTYHDKASKP
jgi:glycosyltransferase involved in cell wall biosynthesis